jgi:hypothetical protein
MQLLVSQVSVNPVADTPVLATTPEASAAGTAIHVGRARNTACAPIPARTGSLLQEHQAFREAREEHDVRVQWRVTKRSVNYHLWRVRRRGIAGISSIVT